MTRIAAPWLDDPAPRAVCAALESGGAQALYVGGCVRNALLGAADSDIDIATDAQPERVMELALAAGLHPVPTGMDHGTITVVADGRGFEVTTFRRDVETDGRRAVVAFSTDLAEDAARRDFTMNALYATRDGRVIDPLGGLPDLMARRLRFIGDAETRIREDYLRSLRFFRFHAWYADADHGFDPDALAAISGTLDGLSTLSRERVGAEMVKLLAAPDPTPELSVMMQTGVLPMLLMGADPRAVGPLVHLEHVADLPPEPMRRLAALGGQDLQQSLRLSKSQAKLCTALRDAAAGSLGAAELGYRFGDLAADILTLRAALMESPFDPATLDHATRGAAQVFPISARDLAGAYQGKALGDRLRYLETAWIRSDFALTTTDMMNLPDTPIK